jgi:hypothetical protein
MTMSLTEKLLLFLPRTVHHQQNVTDGAHNEVFPKYALLLTVLLVATGIVYESTGFSNQPPAAGVQSCGFFDSVFQQREQNRISVEQARAEVDQIKKQLEANNNKFVVGITDAMRRGLRRLVAPKKPQNLQIQPEKRFSAAEAE